MSSIIEWDIQLLHYHTRPYIWIPPPLLFTLVQCWQPCPTSLLNIQNLTSPPAPPTPTPILVGKQIINKKKIIYIVNNSKFKIVMTGMLLFTKFIMCLFIWLPQDDFSSWTISLGSSVEESNSFPTNITIFVTG